MFHNKQRTMSKTIFLSGILLGVTAGLLLAPQKGEDLREDIADNAKKLKKNLYKMAGKGAAEVADLKELLSEEIEGLSENMRHRLLTVLNDAELV